MKAFAGGDIRPISLERSCLGHCSSAPFLALTCRHSGHFCKQLSLGLRKQQGTVGFWDSHRGLILEEGPVRLRHLLSMGLDGLGFCRSSETRGLILLQSLFCGQSWRTLELEFNRFKKRKPSMVR